MNFLHQWVDVGFIHEKLVCKYCDVERDHAYNYYCPTHEEAAKQEALRVEEEPPPFIHEFDISDIGD